MFLSIGHGFTLPSRLIKAKWCILLSVIILLVISYALVSGISYGSIPHEKSLAFASDVIDCEHLKSWQHFFYSKVQIKEIKSDKSNDNSDGLQIDVVSIPKGKIVYHKTSYTGEYEATLLENELKPFIVPENYFQRPWYLRKYSNISLQVTISNYEIPPSKMVAYVILGDDNVNSFFANSFPKPRYEYMIDLLSVEDKVHTITLDRSGYYYVVVEVNTISQLDFFANVTFDYLYINTDDYNFNLTRHLGGVGEVVDYPLDWIGRSLVLCSVTPIPPKNDQSATIHLLVQYKIRLSMIFVIPVIPVIFYALCLSLCMCMKLWLSYQRPRIARYQRINT